MRFLIALALCALLVACGGDGGDDSKKETAGEAAKRQMELLAKDQQGLFYDELHPQLQSEISRTEWMSQTNALEVDVIRVSEVYDEPFTFPDGQTRTITAVTLGFTRGDGPEQFLTVHEELIDGKWRMFRN